ncbi:conserved hypothetical protein [Burkholderiales bacterium 8X]|nr:conserved hypothetical protein [Burkholderiales bacterium 8X]
MQLPELEEYQAELIQRLEDTGLNVSFGNDLSMLLKTYEAATGTGYVQLPFVLDNPREVQAGNFWVCFDDGTAPVALSGFRTMQNGWETRTIGEAYAGGALYKSKKKKEGWLSSVGPRLRPRALFGYIGAGWVHPRHRGHNLAGYIARITQSEALLRTGGRLAYSTAMTAEALFRSGMNLRASGLHHLHVKQVLEGYLAIAEADMKLFLSHSTATELMRFYECELSMMRNGDVVPWLQRAHDKVHARAVLEVATQAANQDVPVSSLMGLLA